MGRLKEFFTEWQSRRAGIRHVPNHLGRSARDVVGWTGVGFSSAWDRLGEGSKAYVKSFEPRVPPSLFVSERDRTRHNQPIPLAERRIEHYHSDDELTPDEIEWGNQPPGT